MKRPIRWIALAVGIVAVVFGVVLAVQHKPDSPSVPRLVLEHRPVPTFTLKSLDGTPITSTALKGKTIVVNFFNSWCIPCQQEAPALKAFYAEHAKDPDFAMVGIIINDDASTVNTYVHTQHMTWPVGSDPNGAASLSFGTTGQPETYVIAPDGTAVCGALGASTQAELDTWLQAARDGQECTG